MERYRVRLGELFNQRSILPDRSVVENNPEKHPFGGYRAPNLAGIILALVDVAVAR
jgi:hypothetical protein